VPFGTACGDSFLSTNAIAFFSSLLWLVSLIMIAASAYALQFLTATRDRARLQNAAPYLHSELFNHGNRVEQRFLFLTTSCALSFLRYCVSFRPLVQARYRSFKFASKYGLSYVKINSAMQGG
jgi:hypothetical protein